MNNDNEGNVVFKKIEESNLKKIKDLQMEIDSLKKIIREREDDINYYEDKVDEKNAKILNMAKRISRLEGTIDGLMKCINVIYNGTDEFKKYVLLDIDEDDDED